MTQGPGRLSSGSVDSDADAGWAVLGTLVSGILVWGGAGYGLDRWLGTGFLVVVGILVGIASATLLVYVKYGR